MTDKPPSLSDYLIQSADVLRRAAGDAALGAAFETAVELCLGAAGAGLPLLVCGNGGSAADALHIEAELVGRFRRARRGLKVLALPSNPALMSAWSNDYTFDDVFARQIEAHGEKGGVLIAISTSGNSANVIAAARAARERAMPVISLTGAGGGKLAAESDVLLAAPSTDTPLIQQLHQCLYHLLCDRIEAEVAADG